MRLEFINRVKVDEILGRNIFTNDGCVLLRTGVKLTQKYIRPVIRVLYETETRKPIKFYEIDLLQYKNIVVQSVI